MRYLVALIVASVVGVLLMWQLFPNPDIDVEDPPLAGCATDVEKNRDFEKDLSVAISLINPMLDEKHRLFVLTEDNRELTFPAPIPVYSGRASVTGNMVVQVPLGCPEIIFNAAAFSHGVKATLGDDVSEDNIHQMLAFLLLHEIGHIDKNHHGQFLPAASGQPTNLNPTLSKKLETEADGFVVDFIGKRISGDVADPDFTAHQLMNFIGYLSFVVSGQKSIDCFGCRPNGSKDIFWDHSQTHENLELRILKINHAVYPTEISEQLLLDFESKRIESGRPRVLYVDPDLKEDTDKPEYGLGLDLDLGIDLDIPGLMDELDTQSGSNEE